MTVDPRNYLLHASFHHRQSTEAGQDAVNCASSLGPFFSMPIALLTQFSSDSLGLTRIHVLRIDESKLEASEIR